MAPDTASKKNRRVSARRDSSLMDMLWGGPERRITGLTLRIISVNAAALLMLMVGVLYLSQYQESLIEAKLETFGTEVGLVSTALAVGADNPQEARDMIRQLSLAMQQRIILFDANGTIAADSHAMIDSETTAAFRTSRAAKKFYTVQVLKNMASTLLNLIPDRRALPPYPVIQSKAATDYPDAGDAMKGELSISAWTDKDDIFLSAAAPLYKEKIFAGAVLLTRAAPDIADDIGIVWTNIIKAFLLTLVLMILLSIYLSGTIARPLKKLARAAEAAREGRSQGVEIPDFSSRHDEIGELSLVLRESTQALWSRMDSIEGFASDVAHELKNPLTSLRSAVETLSIIREPTDRDRLLQVINQDVSRMDRLITDISNVSRLDAELSRDKFEAVNLQAVLSHLLDSYRDPLERSGAPEFSAVIGTVTIHIDPDGENIFVWGLETRLLQIFQNLIANALSFSPAGGRIDIRMRRDTRSVRITVEDQGPGIPENKLKNIFDRFYTERPEHEAYGRHSGLGLSICKQIVDALDGDIRAENLKDRNGKITGARFTVILNTL